MINLNCVNNIINNGLAVHIDLSNIESWDLNTDLTSYSLTQWSNAKSEEKEYLDFGLTGYDNGRVNDMGSSLTKTLLNTKLRLFRVGANDASGNTSYDNYGITPITSVATVGNYFELQGGYLQGFFKLQEEQHEILPPRYANGFTIENVIKFNIGLQTGIFYYMGARAEDKYSPYYSGETQIVTDSGGTTGFTGITTTEGNYLNAYLEEEAQKESFIDFSNQKEILLKDHSDEDIYDNVIAFFVTSDKRLGVRRITEKGFIDQKISENKFDRLGWHVITVTFTPYKLFKNETDIDCEPKRLGDLIFYVDGRQFYKIENYEEIIFRGFKNDKEKTYGVPYNISWGGGSFGLKHSWHYGDFDKSFLVQDERKQNLTIEKYFNSPFLGGIQKLRIYDWAFNSQHALSNAYWESVNHPDLNIVVSKGGRLIIQNLQ